VDIQPRVLVVDADTATLTSVASVAEEEGFDVRTAVDVAGAMHQCRREDIDLVMIDARSDATRADDVLSSIRILKPSIRAVVMEKPLGTDRLHRLFAKLRTESWHAAWVFGEALPPYTATAAGMQPQL
jgi:DNA-binding NtrC family response regulator